MTRAAPLIGVAAIAFAAGVVSALGPGRAEKKMVTDYMRDWARGNYPAMYSLLDSGSKRRTSFAAFRDAYTGAATTATMSQVVPGKVGSRRGDVIPVRVVVRTRVFGTVRGQLQVPIAGSGDSARVRFSNRLMFPGLGPGERLTRHMTLAPRAELLARDGAPLAQGTSRVSTIPDVASQITGTLGPIPAAKTDDYAAQGYPPDAKVGLTGLERVFQRQLAGRPGGTLLAGSRAIARATPEPGLPVTTSIDPRIERAAVAAMAGRSAGIAAMDPRTGEVLALAGFAFSSLQPPGSTFKMITATGALDAGIVKLTDTFPILTGARLDGVLLSNANGESCGGTFLNAFAVSCNSVFAPLGAKLGATRLAQMAKRFGFNEPPSIPGEAESTFPAPSTLPDTLAVGSAAIGQDTVQTTALQMTVVGATIADGGRRPIPTLRLHQRPRFVRVTSHAVASQVQTMMLAVVRFGTGTSAQITGVPVAGKTGTAELRSTTGPGATTNDPKNTDAWFVGYAPAGAPRVVVGALFPEQGAGGTTAAPAVHDVLVAALKAH